ncbi:cytochrome P450 [Nonomuraea roseoviolacea]|uniref:Cytochrome P450 n=1 Tax=Nonomuraea roseoviolacea subsp. carminata TaxID=160689 RepID=A0ABT1K4E8_9ACTN|nr:cytochrome P450 [Nonomuraea roseoviolacea]MCP2348522.1 cytochrome P450 [Nonomuraea roseoviolacea subsp. carminata]
MVDVPEIDLTDPGVVGDPFTAYGRARERSPLARVITPGLPPLWTLTRHEGARAMLADPRFAITSGSFLRPDVPEDCLPYLRTMSEMDGPEHLRLRRLVAPAFTARRAAALRPAIERVVERLLDALPGHPADGDGGVDLLRHFAAPLPMEVICELVGVPEPDRARWHEYGALVASGAGQGFATAIPGITADAREAVTRRRAETAPDLLSELIRAQAEDGDRLTDAELVTLVWHLVLAGQTPAHLIANAVHALLSEPSQLKALREDPALMPRAVEELIRWCGPILLTVPRHAREDVELYGVTIRAGDAVTASVAAANRDPRAFAAPDRLDVTLPREATHLGFAHGPHFCLGASLARVETEAALAALLRRFPGLAPAPEGARRAPDPGTWRLVSLPVTL